MMGFWRDYAHGIDYAWDDIELTDIFVTENPVVAELLDHNGNVIRQFRERPPIGFR